MPAEVESMFSARNITPWHGLGTVVEDAPNSKEAIKLAGLDWNVVQHPVRDGATGIIVPEMFLNVRDSDNSVLGLVGDRYKIVQNADAFDFTDSLIGGEVKYDTAGALRNGRTTWLLVKMENSDILGDAVEQYVCFSNTHDGTGSVKVCVTPVRVVCQNTLNFAINSAKRTWSMRHTGDIAGKLDDARRTLNLVDQYNKNLKAEAEALALQKVSANDLKKFTELLFPEALDMSDRAKRNMLYNRNEFVKCLDAPDLANLKDNKWGVLNAVSDFVTHTEPLRKTDTYQENLWGKVMNGHPVMDAAYDLLKAI